MVQDEITIVLPVHDALPYTRECLRTLDECYPGRRLVIVDDMSNAETREFLAGYAGTVDHTMYVPRQGRGWFTRTANQGLGLAMLEPEPWVLALNTDCVVGPGAFEEMLACWDIAVAEGRRPGMVGSHGPQPAGHRRYEYAQEPAYATGHALLFSKDILRRENMRFPQEDGEVRGFTKRDLVHINSDRALSYQFNRSGYGVVISYLSAIGHHGGRSWGYNLGEVLGLDPGTLSVE